MRVLLDLSTLTELRRPRGNEAVKEAIALISDEDLYLSALVVGEISKGITSLPDGRRKRALSAWLTTLESQFADRILAVDIETAHLWGEITGRLLKSARTLSAVDGLVAATALRHGLRIMTRHAARFEGTGVLIVDPWEEHESAS
jgi:toxin FitB